MSVLTICKGLPGSGKSTWALEQCKKDSNVVRVNKDAIRSMFGFQWNPKFEKLVEELRDAAIVAAFHRGKDVISDDTNLAPKHVNRLTKLAEDNYAVVVINDSFMSVPLVECIARDLKRHNSVGKDVIYQMYCQFVANSETIKYDYENSDCIVALFEGNPYKRDWSKDKLNTAVACIMASLQPRIRIIIVSGRDGKYREETVKWLDENGIRYDYLYMRMADDTREDSIIKKELFNKWIRNIYNVLFVIDDRPRVIRMWRHELGLTVFDVGNGIEF